eukprot:gnl/TRDRNA2_/TRDRNA2_202820_c0_seq1.p1 gnl/TRDRNA2_/TRDRNA2_202820_c0~~gnl/TRDRNA2_/TRDRNA2_202820_c0_seq1.p1  ORF type:complete len:238 (+),score=31.10 gnl/TRDRNA2_/TRDRNA2_202820_c0_seq1:127-840(+)
MMRVRNTFLDLVDTPKETHSLTRSKSDGELYVLSLSFEGNSCGLNPGNQDTPDDMHDHFEQGSESQSDSDRSHKSRLSDSSSSHSSHPSDSSRSNECQHSDSNNSPRSHESEFSSSHRSNSAPEAPASLDSREEDVLDLILGPHGRKQFKAQAEHQGQALEGTSADHHKANARKSDLCSTRMHSTIYSNDCRFCHLPHSKLHGSEERLKIVQQLKLQLQIQYQLQKHLEIQLRLNLQ